MIIVLVISTLIGIIAGLIAIIEYFKTSDCKNLVVNEKLVKVKKAKDILKNYYGNNNFQIQDSNVIWLDLSSSGKKDEVYIIYKKDSIDFIDVFTIKNGDPENLFHEKNIEGDFGEFNANHINYYGKEFFIFSTISASGGYLCLSIYDYDGIGKLNEKYSNCEFFHGRYWIIDNKIYIASNNQRYILDYSNTTFILSAYTGRVKLNTLYTHVLSYNYVNNKFIFKFENEIIKFKKDNDNFISKDVLS